MTGAQGTLQPPVWRMDRPQSRVDLYGALVAVAIASLAYVLALALSWSFPRGLSIVLFSAAPFAAAMALPMLVSRARAKPDQALGWVASGLAVGLTAMVAQLLSFPTVSTSGGPLHTSGDASAALYLVFHTALAAGALAGAANVPARYRGQATGVGLILVLAVAADLVPLPRLLRGDQTFTPTLIGAEWALTLVCAVAAAVWALRVGRSVSPLRGWVGLSLSLSFYDLALNAVAGRRYDPVWWASLSMRVATYALLAVAALVSVLRELRRLESFTDAELDRAEVELGRSWMSKQHLLRSATRLSMAVSPTDVADVVVGSCREATSLTRAAVYILAEGDDELVLLSATGFDAASLRLIQRLPRDSALPGPHVLRTGQPLLLSAQDLARDFPALTEIPSHHDTAAMAAFPLRLANQDVGLMTVSGPVHHAWSGLDREVLGGLAAQAAQALQRALLYERHRGTAEVLQRGLLPRRLPRRGDLVVAARYQPGGDGLQVGGDWYDVLEIADGRVALVVGDVMGKGVHAASIMGQFRNGLRAFAAMDPAPVAVLSGLDRLAADLDDDEIVTVIYVLVDPVTGHARIGRAGHLPALVWSPLSGDPTDPMQAPARLVEEAGSPPIGVPVARRVETAVTLAAGSIVLLFSDGLVEDSRSGLDEGLPALVDGMRDLAMQHGGDLEAFADAVLAQRPAQEHSDDVTLLALRLPTPRTSIEGSLLPGVAAGQTGAR